MRIDAQEIPQIEAATTTKVFHAKTDHVGLLVFIPQE
jgi:hypothetical protein